jgi:hypothetical protein
MNVDGTATTSGRVGGSRPYPWSVRTSKMAEQTVAKVGAAPGLALSTQPTR